MASMKKRLRDAEYRIAQLERNESKTRVGNRVTLEFKGQQYFLLIGDTFDIRNTVSVDGDIEGELTGPVYSIRVVSVD